MDLPSLLMAGSLDTLTSYFSVAFLAIFLPGSVDCLFMPDNNGRSLFRFVA